jgi:FkbM family methyltransferase
LIAIREHDAYLEGKFYRIWDYDQSIAYDIIRHELQWDAYNLNRLQFLPGDVVVDVGGHVGLFAMYMATRWPFLLIHSFEAYPLNADLFERNVSASGLRNIMLHRTAISANGAPVTLCTNPENSGGATSFSAEMREGKITDIPSKTLDVVFEELGISACALLKIDCEGAEYGILQKTAVLPRVRALRAEFHTNRLLVSKGYDPEDLHRHCRDLAPSCDIHYSICEMGQ